MPREKLVLLDRFFREGGADNLGNALRLVADLPWQPPVAVGPLTVLGDQDDPRPTALIVFYRVNLTAADMAPIEALMTALDREGLAPLAVAVGSLKDPAIQVPLGALLQSRKPAIILNTTAFSAMRADGHDDPRPGRRAGAAGCLVRQRAGRLVEFLTRTVAVGSRDECRAAGARRPSSHARDLVQGRGPSRSASRICNRPAAPDPDRVDYVARLAANWARLGATAPAERKIALVLSNYPARGGRAGYAVGLDTTESALDILRLLRSEGYDVGATDWQATDIAPLLTGNSRPICNAARSSSCCSPIAGPAITTRRRSRIPTMSPSMPGCATTRRSTR